MQDRAAHPSPNPVDRFAVSLKENWIRIQIAAHSARVLLTMLVHRAGTLEMIQVPLEFTKDQAVLVTGQHQRDGTYRYNKVRNSIDDKILGACIQASSHSALYSYSRS